MEDDSKGSQSQTSGNQSEYVSRMEARRRRREARASARGSRAGGGWLLGAILIAAGGILMLQNFGTVVISNWWALFILIPAVGAFGNAWRSYQNAGGRLSGSARGSLISGLVLTLVAALFLFNLDWGTFGPILLILGGLGLLLNVVLPS